MIKAILINKQDGAYSARLADVSETELPDAPVTVRIEYSTVNYKDGLAITGKSPVVRKFPMVPGIDFAGIVEASTSAAWRPGDRVLLNGWGVGEVHWGGFAQKARVNAEWLQRRSGRALPRGRRWRSAPPATRRACASMHWCATG